MTELLPLFLTLTGRTVVLVGGGRVAAGKLRQLVAAGASVIVVAPEIRDQLVQAAQASGTVTVRLRPFEPSDLDGAWLVVAAATPDVNSAVAAAAEERHLFVNAVDDPPNASAYLSGVVRRDGVPMDDRKPRLLRALNAIYEHAGAGDVKNGEAPIVTSSAIAAGERGPRVPWLDAPEDSWL